MGVDYFSFSLFFQMMVDGVNSVPTNPYAALSQLSGLAEVIVDAGKNTTHNRRRLNAINRETVKP